jgi:hypothetical protein
LKLIIGFKRVNFSFGGIGLANESVNNEDESKEDEELKKLREKSGFYLERKFEGWHFVYFVLILIGIFLFRAIVLFYTNELLEWIYSPQFYAQFFSALLIIPFLQWLRIRTIDSFYRIGSTKINSEYMISHRSPDTWTTNYLANEGYFLKIFQKPVYKIIVYTVPPIYAVAYSFCIWEFGPFSQSFGWLVTNCIFLIFFSWFFTFLGVYSFYICYLYYHVEKDISEKMKFVGDDYAVFSEAVEILNRLVSLSTLDIFAATVIGASYFPLFLSEVSIPFYILGGILFIGTVLALIIFQFYYIHKLKLRVKNIIMRSINERIREIRGAARRHKISSEPLRIRLEIEKMSLEKFEKVNEFGLDKKTIIELIGTIVVAFIPYIIKFLLPASQSILI